MSDQPRPAFIIKATYILHPDDIAAYKSLAAAFAEATSESPGCAFLHATQDVLDPAVFHLVEGWESQQAFDRELAGDAFQTILKATLKLRIKDRFATRFEVAGAQPLEMPT